MGEWWYGVGNRWPTFPDVSLQSPQVKETTDSAGHPLPSGGALTPPAVRVTRPSLTSDAESLSAAVDEDFARLAKARSNPDILRSTLDHQDVRGQPSQ